MTAPHPTTDRAAALDFIAAQQEDPSTATAYLGTIDDDLEADLDGLDQPWLETLRVCTAPDGSITGAACIEWDTEAGSSWIHGPWATRATWAADAPALVEAMVAQAPVARHEFYGALANTGYAEVAEALGWVAGGAHHEFEADRAVQARPDAEVRPSGEADLPELAALHDRNFPDTYATARQLVDKDGEYTTFVLADDSGLVGYVAGKQSGDDAYLDFVAVSESRRRQGAGRRLVGALAAALTGGTIRLTCSEEQVEALRMYEALGWRQVAAHRAYRSPVVAE